MNLREILFEMKVEAQYTGSMEFDTLGLASANSGCKTVTFLDNEKYLQTLSDDIVIVMTTDEIKDRIVGKSVCVIPEPRKYFFELHNYLSSNATYIRSVYKSIISPDSKISLLAYIAPHNVKIGANTVIEEFVSIKENTVIGDNCIIRAGTVIGGEGFEHKREDYGILSVKHLGGVIIGNNVEIQQLTVVDKAVYPWADTIIEDECKIDNLVHIAHAVHLKKRVLIAAQSCIAGRTVLGENVWIGPGVTVINGIYVQDNARINIGSVATRDVPENGNVTGNFAIEHSKFIRNLKESNKD